MRYKVAQFFLCLLVGVFLMPPVISAQQRKIDSLRNILNTEKEDTNKVNTLTTLAHSLTTINPDSTILLAQQALVLAEKLGWEKGESDAYNETGIGYGVKDDYTKEIANYMKAIKIEEEIGYKQGQATTLCSIGNVYYEQGDYPMALDYYLKGLKMSEVVGYKKGQALNLCNIGLVYYDQGDYPKALDYDFKALKIAEEMSYKEVEVCDLGNIGNIYYEQGDYHKALNYDLKSLKMAKEIGDKQGEAADIGSIGAVYDEQGDYVNAFYYDLKGLKMAEEVGDKQGEAADLGSIGILYKKTGKFKDAEEYLKKAINLDSTIGNYNDLRHVEQSISELYDTSGRYKLALNWYKKAMAMKDTLFNMEKNKALTSKELTYQYDKKEAEAKAEQDKKDALADADKRRELIVIWSACIGFLLILVFSGVLFNRFRITQRQNRIIEDQKSLVEEKNLRLDSAFKNIEIVSQIGQNITSSLNLEEVIGILHEYLMTVMDTSGMSIYIYNPNLKCLEMKYTIGKHKDGMFGSIPIDAKDSFCAYSFKNKKEILVNDVPKEYSKYVESYYWAEVADLGIIHALIIIPLIVGENTIGVLAVQSFNANVYTKEHLEILKALASFMSAAFNNANAYSQLNSAKESILEQKQIIEGKNKDILDSITYAKRLQDAILPALSTIKKYLPESFLLYKPKDIVAGDFYWMEQTGDTILIAAADCTGHGVPGAMVSVVCSNALNRTVKEFKITEPGRILDKVRELVLETFEKSESEVQDGMDISLCCLNIQTKEIQWSGANTPLWYIQNNELKEISPDKQPIGRQENAMPFNTHSLKLQKGDIVYLFTDGYADQFGGPKGKKFKYKQLQEKLLTMASMSMEKQKEVLEEAIESWKGSLEQVDDILIMGIRV